tara:strand:+ start:654 stop:1343 length:690 start_codon:yes stop_codon:yes gene_type:complete
MTENKELRKVIRELIAERMTPYTDKKWTVDVLVSAPEEEGGPFQNKEPIIVSNPRDKIALEKILDMPVPDPDLDLMRKKSKENREKPNPWVDKDGTMSDTEYEDEWGRKMTPAKRFKEIERSFAAQKAYEDQAQKRKADKDQLKKNQDAKTVAGVRESRNVRLTVRQLRELVKEVSKRRPDGYLPSTAKNLYLDREFKSVGGWPEGEYDPPVNVRISNYLKSLGLLDVD